MQKYFVYIPAGLIFLLLVAAVISYQNYFFSTIDPNESAQKYSQSQYVLGEGSPAKISDSELYEYASYAYWLGEDPATINFEHPPLAKYYYGIFFHLFGNPYWGSLLLLGLTLVVLLQLSKLLEFGIWAQSLCVLLVGSLSLFQVHTRYALLDLPQLLATLLVFMSLLQLEEKSTRLWFIILGTSLGLLLSVKYMIPIIAIPLLLVVLQSYRKKILLPYLAALGIAGIVYLVSYTVFFLHQKNMLDFLAFEWYRLQWFMGKTDAEKFVIFQTLFTGSFETWWEPGTYETTMHWSLVWPVSFVLSVLAAVRAAIVRKYQLLSLLLYSFAVLGLYSIGAAASDRFFIQLLPFWILGSVWLLEHFSVLRAAKQ
ncbi:MAG: glycosyltransferase family 39 protein [Patescibacteria group bacterium]